MRSESGQMAASAKGHNQAERASFLEKKRSDDRNGFVRKFLMKVQALGQSLDWFGRAAMASISVRDRVSVSSPLCAATTGRSHKDAIDPERPSTVSELIK